MKKNKYSEEDLTAQNEQVSAEENPVGDAAIENEQANELSYDELLEKYENEKDKNLRLMAEFDNYRKRTLKERAELLRTAGEKILVDMLPLIDDFERATAATESSEDINAVKEGIDLIYHKFISFLERNGVKEISTENEDFDTDRHEALTTFPAPSEEMKGKIIDCIVKGYKLGDKVIRFPKVVVGE
jgi:molecular chaperone GrpE